MGKFPGEVPSNTKGTHISTRSGQQQPCQPQAPTIARQSRQLKQARKTNFCYLQSCYIKGPWVCRYMLTDDSWKWKLSHGHHEVSWSRVPGEGSRHGGGDVCSFHVSLFRPVWWTGRAGRVLDTQDVWIFRVPQVPGLSRSGGHFPRALVRPGLLGAFSCGRLHRFFLVDSEKESPAADSETRGSRSGCGLLWTAQARQTWATPMPCSSGGLRAYGQTL